MKTHLLRLAARATQRHKGRTFLTAGMVALGVSLLIISISWIDGIFGGLLDEATSMAGHVRIVNKDYEEREFLNPLYENIPSVEPLLELINSRPEVIYAGPRITSGVTVTVGEEIGEVLAIAVGASENYYKSFLDAENHLETGRWFENANELVMGHLAARQAGAVIGDDVVLLGITQDGSLSPVRGTLTGILNGGNSFMDRQVFLDIERMQWLTDIPGGALEILVFGEDYNNAINLAQTLSNMPELQELSVKPWNHREPWAGMIEVSSAIRGIIMFLVVLLASLGILNTLMMSVLERTNEIGVLRAMGLGKTGAVGLFVFEALVIALIGGIAGVLLGIGPAWYMQETGISVGEGISGNLSSDIPFSTTIYANLSSEIVIAAFLIGIFCACAGSLLPAIKASGIQPVVAMRTRR